jgi:hypothetical protein
MIGILYSRPILHRLLRGKRSFEEPSLYIEGARNHSEEIFFFSLLDIDWKSGTVKGWNGSDSALSVKPIPSVIINRTRTNRRQTKIWIRRLQAMGKTIFNARNVVSKLDIHRLLAANDQLLPYLPATRPVSYEAVKDLLRQNTSLFLKPSTASIGNGIIRLRKVKGEAVADINVLGRTSQKPVGINQIVRLIRGKKRKYLVQQGISLMKYEGKPVDFRVSVQKNGDGIWQYTGSVAKVGKRKAIVTNLHCGGISIKSSELFRHWGWNGTEMEKKFESLGLSIARTLERKLPNIADLGLDIALDERQHPWFIEANFRDLRITFRNAGETEKWRATFMNPVAYAAYLNKADPKANAMKEGGG